MISAPALVHPETSLLQRSFWGFEWKQDPQILSQAQHRLLSSSTKKCQKQTVNAEVVLKTSLQPKVQ